MVRLWIHVVICMTISPILLYSPFLISNPAQALKYSIDTNLSEINASIIGDGSRFGGDISGVGDVNGDGFDDMVIGEDLYSSDHISSNGKTYLIFGNEFNWKKNMSLPTSAISFIGENDGYQGIDYGPQSGWSVKGAGDVNGDGLDDILIGAPFYKVAGNEVGKVYLIFGKKTGWEKEINLSNSDASFIGEGAHDLTGEGILGAGDINGDGIDDFIINAQDNDEGGANAGQIYLFFGKHSGWNRNVSLANADASFIGANAHDGTSIGAYRGDVNNDGYNDILVGSPGNEDGGPYAGKAYLIFGKSSGWNTDTSLAKADISIIGNPYDLFGEGSIIGDVNNDGYDDFAIPTEREFQTPPINYSEEVFLFFGHKSNWNKTINVSMANVSLIAESGKDGFGYAIAGLGDINGDGIDDIAIGAPFGIKGGQEAGQVYVILGKKNGWIKNYNITKADESFIGEAPGHQIGSRISGHVDLNNDGLDEILISTSNYSTSDTLEEGKVYILFNKPPLTNNPPILDPIDAQNIQAQKEIEIEVKGHDPDSWDSVNLTYSFESAPNGMTINSTTGVISWTPAKAQIGEYTIKVRLTDGKESTNTTFVIIVTKPKQNDHTYLTDYWPVFVILIIIVIIIGFVLYSRMRKRRIDEEHLKSMKKKANRNK